MDRGRTTLLRIVQDECMRASAIHPGTSATIHYKTDRFFCSGPVTAFNSLLPLAGTGAC